MEVGTCVREGGGVVIEENTHLHGKVTEWGGGSLKM